MSINEEFSREKYAKSDILRGAVMLIIFLVSFILGFATGILGMGYTWVGGILLLMSLIISLAILKRANYPTKRSTDYFIAFMLSLFTFLSFWIISLNIP